MAHDDKILIDMERQKSKNWCWLAVALAIAKKADASCEWTQERILLAAAELGLQQHLSKWDKDRIDTIKYQLLNNDGTAKFSSPADIMLKCATDWRGPLSLSLESVGCLGTTHKTADFPKQQKSVFEFITEEVRLSRPLVAQLTYNQSTGNSAGVNHALLIIGTMQTATGDKSFYWMDPDPQKTALGTVNCTPEADFNKLQGKAEFTAMTTTGTKVNAVPAYTPPP